MLGAIQKFLANQAGNVSKLKSMPLEELVAMLGSKSKAYGSSVAGMAKAKPKEAAGIAGLGALAGAGLSGGEEEPEEDDELLRAYGLR